MGGNGARQIRLSQGLIDQLKAEMQDLGLKNPAVVVVYDRDEVSGLRSQAQPMIGYPSDIDACECTEVKDVEPFQSGQASTCCVLKNGEWWRGIGIPPFCYPISQGCWPEVSQDIS